MRSSSVTSAGQVPTGFDPDRLYQSRSHPRGLALTIYGASDAVRSLGIEWDVLRQKVQPDQFAVYSGSAMGQLDIERQRRHDAGRADGQARDVETTAAGPVRNAGRFHQRVRARQPRRDRRDHRRVRDVPVQPAPGHRRHPERPPPRRDGRQRRSADHARDHRRLSDDGRARGRRSADGARRPHRRGGQPSRLPAVLRQLRLYAFGSRRLHGADGRRARARTRRHRSTARSRTST